MSTTETYTLSLHDPLPIFDEAGEVQLGSELLVEVGLLGDASLPLLRLRLVDQLDALFFEEDEDRKSTRLNSSHLVISYAVFCLKKKKKQQGHSVLHQRVDY